MLVIQDGCLVVNPNLVEREKEDKADRRQEGKNEQMGKVKDDD